MVETRSIVVLSDLHLGTDAPTNGYQSELHAPFLHATLDFLADQSDRVREVILLGDFVDLWSYPPEQAPPTFADVVDHAANRSVFDRFRTLLDRIPRISFVPGHTDMTLTQRSLRRLQGPESGRTILVRPDPYLPLGNGSMVCTHGHEFSLMCAPYDHGRNRIAPHPIGYYATRAGAYAATARLRHEGKRSVAELPAGGAPPGIEISAELALETLLETIVESVGHAMITAVQAATGIPWDLPIAMPDGLPSRSLRAAARDFDDLFPSFTNRAGPDGLPLGYAGAVKALLFPDAENDLTSYAAALAAVHGARLVVMGHTHVTKEDATLRVGQTSAAARPAPFVYANCGFHCPSRLDLERRGRVPTLVIVGVQEELALPLTVEHRAVLRGDDGRCAVAPAPLLGSFTLAADQHPLA